MNISLEKISLLIMVMLMLVALRLTILSMTDLRIEGNYLFPICRPTSGTWSTSSLAFNFNLRGSRVSDSDSVTPLGPNQGTH